MYRKILIRVGIAFAALVVLVLVLAAMRPDYMSFKRQIVIEAPAKKVQALIEDFTQWPRWSPWEKLDPNLKRKYSGPKKGVGSVYEWEGNDQVGKGRMEIVEVEPEKYIKIDLRFISPIEAHNTSDFRLTPKGDDTEVTWEMGGPTPFMQKLMSLFIDFDKMIGKDFEAGLASMKAAAEK